MGWGGAIPVPHQDPPQDPYLVIFLASGPTYGQMKAISEVSMRFPKIGSQIDPELTQIDPRIDPPRLVPRWPSDEPPDPQIQDLRYQGLE